MGHVLIVGAGPAGAGLALLLADRGVRVTLVERQQDFEREFRGEILLPSGLHALDQMGVLGDLEGVRSQAQNALSVYMNGESVFKEAFDGAVFGDYPVLALSQADLLEKLVDLAARNSNFQLMRGASVKDLTFDGDRVTGVRIRTADGEKHVTADLVVGADGRASIVRKKGGFKLTESSPPLDVVWCKLPCPPTWDGPRAYIGRGHLLLAYRSWDQQLQLAWIINKGSFGELKSRGIGEWLEDMALQVSPDLAMHIRSHIQSVSRPFLLDAASNCVECWSIPGALLIGDAAHVMSPVGGQGINIALRDAIVAANHLVPVLSGPGLVGLGHALVAIESERMPEISKIQRLQSQPPKIALSSAWWGEPLRKLISCLVARPGIRAFIAARGRELPFGVTDVELEV